MVIQATGRDSKGALGSYTPQPTHSQVVIAYIAGQGLRNYEWINATRRCHGFEINPILWPVEERLEDCEISTRQKGNP